MSSQIVRGETVPGTNAGSFAPHRQAEPDPGAVLPGVTEPSSRFCQCEPYTEDRGGGYIEYMLDYNPGCPVHSRHVYDPHSGEWIFANDPDAARALHELEALCDTPVGATFGTVSTKSVMEYVSRLRKALHLPEPEPVVWPATQVQPLPAAVDLEAKTA